MSWVVPQATGQLTRTSEVLKLAGFDGPRGILKDCLFSDDSIG